MQKINTDTDTNNITYMIIYLMREYNMIGDVDGRHALAQGICIFDLFWCEINEWKSRAHNECVICLYIYWKSNSNANIIWCIYILTQIYVFVEFFKLYIHASIYVEILPTRSLHAGARDLMSICVWAWRTECVCVSCDRHRTILNNDVAFICWCVTRSGWLSVGEHSGGHSLWSIR